MVTKKYRKYKNVGIITPPVLKATNHVLMSFVDLLSSISKNIYVITWNFTQANCSKAHVYSPKYKKKTNIFAKVIGQIYLQLIASFRVIELRGKVDCWFFFLGGSALLLPILTAKLLRRKVILVLTGSIGVESSKLDLILATSQHINLYLSDRVIVYSERLIKEWGLEKHLNKVSIAQEHFLDVDKFRIQKNLDKRDDLCGYIGALEKWKGVLNFIEASLKVLVRREDVRFLIGGEGRLKSGIEELVNIKGLNDKIRIVGLIPHDEVPKYLNELKLLVLPSHTEGLPNIILEAMACGTPVLATPVGAIPDVIKDEETGFIMEDNTPDCIAKNIIRALNHPNLDEIVKRARNLIEEQFTYEAAVERYKKILEVLD